MNDNLAGWSVFNRGLFVYLFVCFPTSTLNTPDHIPMTCKINVKKQLVKYRGSFYVTFCFSCHFKNSTINVCLFNNDMFWYESLCVNLFGIFIFFGHDAGRDWGEQINLFEQTILQGSCTSQGYWKSQSFSSFPQRAFESDK